MRARNKLVLPAAIIALVITSSFVHAEGLIGVQTGSTSSPPIWTLFGELPVGNFLTFEGSITPNSAVTTSYSLGARVGRTFGGYASVTSTSTSNNSFSYSNAGVFIQSKITNKATILCKAGVDLEEYKSKYVGQGRLLVDIVNNIFAQVGVHYSLIQGVSTISSSVGVGLKF